MRYGDQAIGVMPNPEAMQRVEHHSGIVQSVTVADHFVDVELATRTGQTSIVVRFSHTFDPLLAVRAANLAEGMNAALSVVAWSDSNGVVRRRDGRGLSA